MLLVGGTTVGGTSATASSSSSLSSSSSNTAASSSSITTSSAIVSSSAVATCTTPAWNSATVYTGGEIVSRSGRKFQACWWTQNNQPTVGAVCGGEYWKDIGSCP